jgi:hypothetical protein
LAAREREREANSNLLIQAPVQPQTLLITRKQEKRGLRGEAKIKLATSSECPFRQFKKAKKETAAAFSENKLNI